MTVEERPEKKRKTYHQESRSSEVISISVTPDQKHAVAVTGDDKAIRVLRIEAEGVLTQISRRCMPKRPCAIYITTDSQTIICGDKFGDVYSLPLFYSSSATDVNDKKYDSLANAATSNFRPEASELTVHTKRNREALEQQLKMKERAPIKDSIDFDCQLLLGHVSMLTDLICASEKGTDGTRDYIITADRDEHIRISRGPPHSYVIEGFCLGHHEFVSRLCLVTPTILVSGGGDDHLLVWDWKTGLCVKQLDLRTALHRLTEFHLSEKDIPPSSQTEESDPPQIVAISGLWCYKDFRDERKNLLYVACEAMPVVLYWEVDGILEPSKNPDVGVLRLDGNVLDLVSTADSIFVSIDNVHEPGSSSSTRSKPPNGRLFRLGASNNDENVDGALPGNESSQEMIQQISNRAIDALGELRSKEGAENQHLRDLLYTTEKLRKRNRGTEDEQ